MDLSGSPSTPTGARPRQPCRDFSPDSAIEKALANNPFLQAAVAQFYTIERPTTWHEVPFFAENSLVCPPPTRAGTDATNTYIDSGYGSSYIAPAGSTLFEEPNNKQDSSASSNVISVEGPVTDRHSASFSEVESESRDAHEIQPDRADYRKPLIVTSVVSHQKDDVLSPMTETSEASLARMIPPGFTTQRVCSQPAAYLLKHDSNEGGIILSPDGKIQSYIQDMKQSSAEYFAQLAENSQNFGYQPTHPLQPFTQSDCYNHQPPFYYEPMHQRLVNPFQGLSQRMPQLKDDVIPRIDISGYSNVLHLPTNPSDILIYFNSICGAASLSKTRKLLIEDNIQGTTDVFNLLDDCIFQMCDALNTTRLRKEEGYLVYDFVTEIHDGKIKPSSTIIEDWKKMVKECRDHLTGLGNLGYSLVLNKGKVDAVRGAIVHFKDSWENEIFGGCIDEDWEAWSDDLEIMKEYNTFNREIQRLMKEIEDDLLLVARLENMTVAFGNAVFKAEMKLLEVERKYWLGGNGLVS
ncbi:hypothetical protein AA313_de0200398 [Arthrobotrys entomopaga]|nr:hypothetical protein AA313_de0200398 [Arthrobotrys entomopaga]